VPAALPEKTVERLLALRWWRFCLYDCYQVPFRPDRCRLDQMEDLADSGAIQEYRPERYAPERLKAPLPDIQGA